MALSVVSEPTEPDQDLRHASEVDRLPGQDFQRPVQVRAQALAQDRALEGVHDGARWLAEVARVRPLGNRGTRPGAASANALNRPRRESQSSLRKVREQASNEGADAPLDVDAQPLPADRRAVDPEDAERVAQSRDERPGIRRRPCHERPRSTTGPEAGRERDRVRRRSSRRRPAGAEGRPPSSMWPSANSASSWETQTQTRPKRRMGCAVEGQAPPPALQGVRPRDGSTTARAQSDPHHAPPATSPRARRTEPPAPPRRPVPRSGCGPPGRPPIDGAGTVTEWPAVTNKTPIVLPVGVRLSHDLPEAVGAHERQRDVGLHVETTAGVGTHDDHRSEVGLHRLLRLGVHDHDRPRAVRGGPNAIGPRRHDHPVKKVPRPALLAARPPRRRSPRRRSSPTMVRARRPGALSFSISISAAASRSARSSAAGKGRLCDVRPAGQPGQGRLVMSAHQPEPSGEPKRRRLRGLEPRVEIGGVVGSHQLPLVFRVPGVDPPPACRSRAGG